MDQLLTTLGSIPPLAVYGFVLVWLAAESAGVPVPNEVVLLLAGSVAARHDVFYAAATIGAAVLGSVLGANLGYAIGRRGGRAAVLRLGRLVRLDEKRLDSIEVRFEDAGFIAIFLARITPLVRTLVSLAAGVLRMPRRTFEVATLAGSLLWCTVIVTVGYLLGANYTAALTLIGAYTIPAVLALVALVAGYILVHRILSRAATGHPSKAQVREVRAREREVREREV